MNTYIALACLVAVLGLSQGVDGHGGIGPTAPVPGSRRVEMEELEHKHGEKHGEKHDEKHGEKHPYGWYYGDVHHYKHEYKHDDKKEHEGYNGYLAHRKHGRHGSYRHHVVVYNRHGKEHS